MAAPKFQTSRVLPRSVSPIVRRLFDQAKADRVHMTAIADRMSLRRETLYYWKSGVNTPRIDDLENMAAILGYRIELVKND